MMISPRPTRAGALPRLACVSLVCACASAVPPPSPPLQSRAPALPAAPRDIELPTTTEDCQSGARGECLATRNAYEAIGHATLPDCPLASEITLLNPHHRIPWCELVIRTGNRVSIVNTLSACNVDIQGGVRPRVAFGSGTCSGDRIAVELVTTDGAHTARPAITCTPTDAGLACRRAPELGLAPAGVTSLLEDLQSLVAAHRWQAMLELCDPEHRREQLEVTHLDVPTYLAEILELHTVGNAIADRVSFADLDTIERIEFIEVSALENPAGWFEISGIVHARGGKVFHAYVRVKQRAGRWWLAGAVG